MNNVTIDFNKSDKLNCEICLRYFVENLGLSYVRNSFEETLSKIEKLEVKENAL